MKFTIKEEKTVFDTYFKIIQAKVEYETFNGNPIQTTRFAFERGDSVAVLLYDSEAQNFIFTNQFRYPTCKHNIGWITEIAAGSVEKNEDPISCAKREVMEELGYSISSIEHIQTFYTSPGGSTERMFLYYAEVTSQEKIAEGGGLKEENEDIQQTTVPKQEIKNFMTTLEDAKTILALQWFLLNKN